MLLAPKNLSFNVLVSAAEEQKRAKAYLAMQAPSQKLLVDDPESTSIQELSRKTEGKVVRVVAVKKRKVMQTGWFEDAKKLGRHERHQKLDLDVWKELFCYADPSYFPPLRAKLKTQHNITVSCDGGTTKGRDAFWTIHMSTMSPSGRKVYLIEV
ncbi:hypothetical protein B0H34DRAFT_727565 [Crassisporium funariophilum]|nr:hypothetical protein B0H34DRAFT_727565 [Crassisporium funariophilum]